MVCFCQTKSIYLRIKESNSAARICELISKRMENIKSSLKETGRNINFYTDKCLITLFALGEKRQKKPFFKCHFSLIIPSFFKKHLFLIDKEWWKLHFRLSCVNCSANASKVIWQLASLKTLG